MFGSGRASGLARIFAIAVGGLRWVQFVYFRGNNNGDFNNVVLFSVFQFSDEDQGPKYKNRLNSIKL